VIIDEVQKAPALLGVVHQLAERPRSPRVVLMGSRARKLKRTGVDLLAGRAPPQPNAPEPRVES